MKTPLALALTVLLSIASIGGKAAEANSDSPPNVVLVMTDDQGYGDLACLGNPILKTPHLDKLHAESVRLTNYHVSPTCSPTRGALMSGRNTHMTGVWHTIMGRSIMRTEEVTIAEALKAAGYATGFFGKWHLGDNYPHRPRDQGFENVLMHGGGGVVQTPDWFGNDYFDDTYFRNGKPEKKTGFCTDVWFDEAMKFIVQSKQSGKPFFCYIPTNAAHGPMWAPKKYEAMYRDDPRVPDAGFYGMITNIDDNMGRMVELLDKQGLADNTILIFTTDNGSAIGRRKGKGFNAGMRGHKGSPYDGGHRVPFFIRWPGGKITGGRDIDTLTAHVDVLPTLLELCKVERGDGPELHGRSLVPLLTEEKPNWPARTIVVDSQRKEFMQKYRNYSVMTDRWRLLGEKKKELYDILEDPGQKTNVADRHPEVVERLAAEYEDYWKMIEPMNDTYVRIVLGNEAENPARLTCHDWHIEQMGVPWHQAAIRMGIKANGFWTVDVDTPGSTASAAPLAARRG